MFSYKKILIFHPKARVFKKQFSILTRHLSLFKVILTSLKREHADNLWSKCHLTTHRIGQTYITCQSYSEKLQEKTTVQRTCPKSCHFFLYAEYTIGELERIRLCLWIEKLTMKTLTKMWSYHFNVFEKKITIVLRHISF